MRAEDSRMDPTAMGSFVCGGSTMGGHSVLNGSVAVSQSVSAVRSRSSTSPTRTCQQRILAAGSSERLLATVSPTPNEAGLGLSSSSSSLGRCSFLVDSQTQLNGGFNYYNRKVSSIGSGRTTHRHHTAGSIELGESRLRSKFDAPGKQRQRSTEVMVGGGSEGNVGVGRGAPSRWSASNLNGSLPEEEKGGCGREQQRCRLIFIYCHYTISCAIAQHPVQGD